MNPGVNPASISAPSVSDVIIVGAGPVGLLLANLLGARGIPTDLFDKRTGPLTSSMAIGITPPSLDILSVLGLDGVFRDAGVPVRHAEVYELGTRVGRLDFAGIASNYPFFLSLPQARTVEILRHNLAKFPNVTIHDGAEFSGLEQDAQGVQAAFRDSVSGRDSQFRGRFLIGADGHKSAVRVAAGLKVRERLYPQRFIMADFTDDSGLGDEARLFFTPEASVESFPLPDGFRRWIVQVHGAQENEPVDYLIRTVRRLAGFDLGRRTARYFSAFGAKRMVVDSYHAGRVLLAGDAAHVMSSIGGQGMNTGFADAEMLAAILPTVLRHPAQMPRSFAAYDRIRRRSYEVAANRAERGMWLGTRRGRFASWFRKHLIRDVLFSPLMQRHLAPHFAMLTIPYRNLNWVPPGFLATE
jgi:2-polyprenyl-6-methoxyphenol hydroxylase-like FAD-dependent oxidoreductase